MNMTRNRMKKRLAIWWIDAATVATICRRAESHRARRITRECGVYSADVGTCRSPDSDDASLMTRRRRNVRSTCGGGRAGMYPP